MKYRSLGSTGLQVSEVGLGGEYLERENAETVYAVVDEAMKQGINILDIFMSEPNVRTILGAALKGRREKMILQGHIGSAWRMASTAAPWIWTTASGSLRTSSPGWTPTMWTSA